MENIILELRELETQDDILKIRAKVNDYTFSKMMKDKYGRQFREICPRETWEGAIKNDIRVLINHKGYYNVGNFYKIDITNEGVFLEVELDPLKERGIYESVKNGVLNQVSFGFKVIKDAWYKCENYLERKLEKIKLVEISLLDCTAAYNGTKIECRNITSTNKCICIKRKKLELQKVN